MSVKVHLPGDRNKKTGEVYRVLTVSKNEKEKSKDKKDKKEKKDKREKQEWTRSLIAAINRIPEDEDSDVQFNMFQKMVIDAAVNVTSGTATEDGDGKEEATSEPADDRTGKQTKRPRPSSASSGEVDPLPERKWRKLLADAIFHGSKMVGCLQELMHAAFDGSDEDSKDRSVLENITNYGSDENSKDRNVLEKVMNYGDSEDGVFRSVLEK